MNTLKTSVESFSLFSASQKFDKWSTMEIAAWSQRRTTNFFLCEAGIYLKNIYRTETLRVGGGLSFEMLILGWDLSEVSLLSP